MSEDLVCTQSHCDESYSPGHHVCMLQQYSTGLNLCKLQKFSCSDIWNAELSRSRLSKLINLRPASLWYYRLKCLAIERLLSNTRQLNDIYHLNREICHNFVICSNFRTALEGTRAAQGQPFCKAVVFLVSKKCYCFVSCVWSRALFITVIVYRLNTRDRIVKVPSAFITYPIFSLFYSSLEILLKRSSRPVNIARTNDLVQDKIVEGLRLEYEYEIE